ARPSPWWRPMRPSPSPPPSPRSSPAAASPPRSSSSPCPPRGPAPTAEQERCGAGSGGEPVPDAREQAGPGRPVGPAEADRARGEVRELLVGEADPPRRLVLVQQPRAEQQDRKSVV